MKWFITQSITAILASSLLMTGCGDDSSPEACSYGVQQNLDQGNYQAVIDTLDNNQTCGGELSQNDAWLNLGAAYMGKAGLTMGNLLGAVVDSNNSSAMESFMISFADAATAEGLQNLRNAKDVYSYIDNACDGTETGAAAEACLYSGLSTLTETIGSLSAILGSETLSLLSTTVTTGGADDVNSNATADGLDITACAISDANATVSGPCTEATVSYTIDGDVTFTDTLIGFSETYSARTFTVSGTPTSQNNVSEIKLISTIGTPSPVTTDGFCETNFDTCIEGDPGCYPCPVVVDGITSTATSGLLTIINGNDLDALSSVLPTDDNNVAADISTDLVQSIGDTNTDGIISEAELAAFLSTL